MAARRPVEGHGAKPSPSHAGGSSSANLPGQVLGYWFETQAEIPKQRPSFDPTGAVLPRPGENLQEGGVCLDLVQVDGRWFALSEAAVHTYLHSERLVREHSAFFVPADRWGKVYEAHFDERLTRSKLRQLYGARAAARARPDFPALQVRLQPLRA